MGLDEVDSIMAVTTLRLTDGGMGGVDECYGSNSFRNCGAGPCTCWASALSRYRGSIRSIDASLSQGCEKQILDNIEVIPSWGLPSSELGMAVDSMAKTADPSPPRESVVKRPRWAPSPVPQPWDPRIPRLDPYPVSTSAPAHRLKVHTRLHWPDSGPRDT